MFCLFNSLKTGFEPRNYTDGNSDFSATEF